MDYETQRTLELEALTGALAAIEQIEHERQTPRRSRRAVIRAIEWALTNRRGPFRWEWGCAFTDRLGRPMEPFTEPWCSWQWGRESFEGHGSLDIYFRLTAFGRPLTPWLPRQWADQPESKEVRA